MEQQEKIKVLQDVIRINSVNGNELEVATYLQTLLEKHGITSKLVEFSPNRANLVAEIGPDSEAVLGLSGHMDVVAAGDPKLWKYDPFSATIEGNRLYGRGSTDMKSGLVAMVLAMIELHDEKVPLKIKIRLLATVGEEVGELGSKQLTELGYADDLTSLIIGEPTGYNLVYTHMGSLNYRVISTGKEAHSSMPEEGINAIDNMQLFMDAINPKMAAITKNYQNKELHPTIHNITTISGGNQVNSIPGESVIQGNIRSIPESDNQQLIAVLQGTVDELNQQKDVNLKLIIDYDKMPVKANPNSDLIHVIQRAHTQADSLPLIGISATTDAAEFTKANNSFDFVIFGPGEQNLPHQIDEYVQLDNYLEMIEIYKKIAAEYI